MIHLDVIQGSQEWLNNRLNAFNASEAPVMMACHPNMKRSELLEAKATCNPKQYSDFVEKRVFAKGHETEAKARPILEAKLDEDLYPVSGKNGDYQASFDGLTLDESIGFEHKQYSLELFELIEAGDPPPYIYWQLEHQLLVNPEMEKVILVCSDGTPDNWAQMEYTAVEGRREKLIAGWEQFAEDLVSFTPTEKVIEATGVRPDSLPALFVDVAGQLTTTSNLAEFRQGAEMLIGSIKTELQTDDDFANADEAIKWLAEGEKKIDSAIEQAMSRTGPLEELVRTLKDVQQNLMRTTRLKLNRQVEAQKVNRRNEIVAEAKEAMAAYLQDIDSEFSGISIAGQISPDFYLAIKGKRNFESMVSACDDLIAQSKIQITEIAAKVRKNLETLAKHKDHDFLFPNKQTLALMEPDHLTLKVKSDIDNYKQQQAVVEEQRIQGHKNTLARLKAAGDCDDIPLEELENTRRRAQEFDTAGMEEFAEEAASAKETTLKSLSARIKTLQRDKVIKEQEQDREAEQAKEAQQPEPPAEHDAHPAIDDLADEKPDQGYSPAPLSKAPDLRQSMVNAFVEGGVEIEQAILATNLILAGEIPGIEFRQAA